MKNRMFLMIGQPLEEVYGKLLATAQRFFLKHIVTFDTNCTQVMSSTDNISIVNLNSLF